MYERILACLDGSKTAEQILPYIESMALAFNSRLVLVEVIDLSAATWDHEGQTLAEQKSNAVEKAELYLEKTVQPLKDKGVDVEYKILKTVPVGTAIKKFAQDNDFDLVAMVTHGRSGLGRLMLGSVAEYVLKESKLPMLVIKAEQ